MQRGSTSIWRRSWLASVAGLAVASAVFGSGFFAANAFDGGGATPAQSEDGHTASDRPSVPGGPPQRSGEPEDMPVAGGKGGLGGAPLTGGPRPQSISVATAPYGCAGVLGEVISGTSLNLAHDGFQPRFAGDGFVLRSLSIRGDGSCAPDGRPSTAPSVTVLETSWHHPATGLEVSISQRPSAEPVANILQGSSAMFWSAGYAFHVNVYGFMGSSEIEAVEVDSSGGAARAQAPGVDPRWAAFLADVVSRLAPDLGASCFYRESQGGWESLPALGIGDPRPAIPAGFKDLSVQVRTFAAPSPSCGGVAAEEMGGLNATFERKGPGGDFGGAIFVGANPVSNGGPEIQGHLDDYSASWTSGRWQFFVGAKMQKPIGREVIVAIARALDPNLDVTKLSERPLPPDVKSMPGSSPR